MRRVLLGVAAGAVLVLAAATGVSAYWQAQETIPIETVSSGDLTVTASWAGGPPEWEALFPGESVESDINVTVNGEGDTLDWIVDVESPSINPAFTFQAWQGSCDTGTALPAAGSPEALSICVRYTLRSDADSSLQGKSFEPQITVTAEQVSG